MSGSERINRYSSGMYVRLAFAVAAHLEPEPRRRARRDRLPRAGPEGFVARESENQILIVDEVLAVGFRLVERYSSERGAEFQKKCLGKMKDVAGHGRKILWN